MARSLILALAAPLLLYLAAAFAGSLLSANRHWEEPSEGTIILLRSNGIHVDIVMPIRAQGLDWRPLFPMEAARGARAEPVWIGFGAGERRVYLETPTWWDLRPRTLWSALTGGAQVLHVDRTLEPGARLRAIRLRPAEYRRLWAAIRADMGDRPRRIDHPGYGHDDAFYEALGQASALHTCNNWVADKLRAAGVRTSLWSPFAQGLLWRYRRVPRGQPG